MLKVEEMREKTFNIRFSEEEWDRLDRLSSAQGINAASLIRMLLKQADVASGYVASAASKQTKKAAPKVNHADAPYLEKAGKQVIIFVPDPGGSMGRMLDPKRDAVEARKAVATFAKRKKLDVDWVRAKETELGISLEQK